MKDNAEKQNFGVKLTNELMTDIIGAIIPGSLFVVCLGISVVIPMLIILSGCNILKIGELGGAASWVMLIVFLILSYVFGLLFYRADIKEPDKTDIERQIIGTAIKYTNKNGLYHSHQEIISYVQALRDALQRVQIDDIKEPAKSVLTVLKSACDDFHLHVVECKEPIIDNNSIILKILFPEDFVGAQPKLSQYSIDVFDYYRTLFLNLYNKFNLYERHPFLTIMYFFLDNSKVKAYKESQQKAKLLQEDCMDTRMADFDTNQIEDDRYLQQYARSSTFRNVLLHMYSCILSTQCELGCCSKNRGEFPYMNYYKYLLKRNLNECLTHVDWCSRESRSKNQLNEYKIEIQVFASESYALLNKNESHIRMSSASWYVAYRIRVISWGMMFVIIIVFLSLSRFDDPHVLLFLFPMSISMLSALIKRRISKFIHYQRLREIYYTLFVYNDYKRIIDARKQVMSQDDYYLSNH